MKHPHTFLFVLLCCLFGFLPSTLAQTTLAKLKYEEAEKAYQEGNYKTTLALVDEVEKMIKGTSPKTLYLKILAKNKLIPTAFKEIEDLRADCGFFVNKYDNLEDNEDRYREVYEISKSLNRYPKSEQEFLTLVRKRETQKQHEEAYKKKVAEYPIGEYGLTIGMEKNNIPKKLLQDLKLEKGRSNYYSYGNISKPGYLSLSFNSKDQINFIYFFP